MLLYRWQTSAIAGRQVWTPPPTRRVPKNIPYLIDNLWEYLRPVTMPSRRHVLLASPSPEQARDSGSPTMPGGRLYRVTLPRGGTICQIPQNDAKHHPDVSNHRRINEVLLAALGGQEFIDGDLARKSVFPLWSPCLLKDEVASILDTIGDPGLVGRLQTELSFWRDAAVVDPTGPTSFPNGEVFIRAEICELWPVEGM